MAKTEITNAELFDQIKALANSSDKKFDSINRKFDDLVEIITFGFQKTEDRFQAIDQRFDRLEGKMDRVETKLDNLEKRIGQMEEDILDIKAILAVQGSILKSQSEDDKAVARRIDYLESELKFLKKRLKIV
jgi:chromosome segregation ATPase